MIYIDTTALVKLIVHDSETERLRAWRGRYHDRDALFSSISRAEIRQAFPCATDVVRQRIREVLGCPKLIEIQPEGSIEDVARGLMVEGALKHAQAVHLATIVLFRRKVESILSYDIQLLSAAARLGIDP